MNNVRLVHKYRLYPDLYALFKRSPDFQLHAWDFLVIVVVSLGTFRGHYVFFNEDSNKNSRKIFLERTVLSLCHVGLSKISKFNPDLTIGYF